MYRLIYLFTLYVFVSLVVSCSGSGQSSAVPVNEEVKHADSVVVEENDGDFRLIHNGTSDTVYMIVTQVFSAKNDGDSIVKNGKPDFDREFSAFPNEDTCVYDTAGHLKATYGKADGINYRYEYEYEENLLSEELYYQNGDLFYDRRYIYDRGQRVNTVEELYIAGSKTVNEYPVDLSKVSFKDGNRIEYGDTRNDYTITDARGNVVKESSYSEMDDYSSVIEYTYNDRGWRISINCEGEYLYTFDYTNIDAHGNWSKAVIRCNGIPYGIVEREIFYY